MKSNRLVKLIRTLDEMLSLCVFVKSKQDKKNAARIRDETRER